MLHKQRGKRTKVQVSLLCILHTLFILYGYEWHFRRVPTYIGMRHCAISTMDWHCLSYMPKNVSLSPYLSLFSTHTLIHIQTIVQRNALIAKFLSYSSLLYRHIIISDNLSRTLWKRWHPIWYQSRSLCDSPPSHPVHTPGYISGYSLDVP